MYPIRLLILIFLLILYRILRANVSNAQKLRDPSQFMVEIRVRNVLICVGAYVKGYDGHNILTRASCVTRYVMRLYKIVMRNRKGKRVRRRIEHMAIYPYYKKNKRAYDIALLKTHKVFDQSGAAPIDFILGGSYENCRIHTATPVIETQSLTVISLSNCTNLMTQLESTFVCGVTDEDWCPDNGYLVECDMRLVGIGCEPDLYCGEFMPYIIYDMDAFDDWIRFNKYRGGTVTFRLISVTNIYLEIIIVILSFI